ncbi:hypothetical protein ACN20G_05645 [Streptomyces sp. BI20]|uniref:hypothetical protein n=1 Tax=Streptomyces sp. BI20 TaxID=3403460 RepID=UPI003C76CCAD
MSSRAWVRSLPASVVAVLALCLGTVAFAPVAHAASGPVAVGEALRENPVYVDPRVTDQLPPDRAEALAKRIKDADKPLFVAVLPATSEFPPKDLLGAIRTGAGITGTYAVRLGTGFNAGSDPSVLSRSATANLTAAVKAGGPVSAADQLDAFVTQALPQLKGKAPASWGGGGDTADGVGAGALIGFAAVLVAGGGAGYALVRSRRRKQEAARAEALARLRVVVDEDITAFGEELDRLDFHPGEPGADDAMRADWERGLDSYERAKAIMARVTRPDEVTGVTEALEDGRFALASLAARREGRPLPERRTPCFFDPRHGVSVEDVEWTPQGGAARTVPVCAADAVRLREGREPMVRTVETAEGRRPYYDAGPAYGPWAGGYFGGGMLPGLLVGTMLGSMMATPAYASDFGGGFGGDAAGAGFEGGDVSGADFDPSAFGGGDFGGGGGFGGGGDFGGGGGFD